MKMCVCIYVNVGFQDENESNGYFIYEKYFILSEREKQARAKKDEEKEKTCNACMLLKRNEREKEN